MKDVSCIGIVGNGMIGDSMTVLTTGHGYKTVSVARNPAKIPGYKAKYDEYYQQMIEHGLLTQEQFRICESYLNYTTDYAELADCDVIFECIVENLEQKHQVYARIEKNCPKVKAICSVSSSFLPDKLGEKMEKYADRVLVAHPFNPAHMVPYFEICTGEKTAPGLAEWVKEFLISLDRKPVILKKAAPGFIGNRLQFALWREALNILESGIADPEDIDTCLNYSFCPRYASIGIFEHFDNGDLRLNQTTCNGIFPTLSNIDRAPAAVTDRISRGDTGARAESHIGFYDWNGIDMKAYAERVNKPYWDFCRWNFPDAPCTE